MGPILHRRQEMHEVCISCCWVISLRKVNVHTHTISDKGIRSGTVRLQNKTPNKREERT